MQEISHGKVVLRPWSPDDVDALIGIAQCARVQAWLKDWIGVEEWAAPWLQGQLWRHEKGMPELEFMSWAITVPPSPAPVGVINLGGDETGHRGVSLGYFLHERALGNGYATDAVQALCHYAFDRWGFSEICANAHVENLRSRAVLERAGFAFQEVRPTHLEGWDGAVPCAWYVRRT